MKHKKQFFSFLLCALCFVILSVYAEDIGYTSKVVFRKVMIDGSAIKALGIETKRVSEQTVRDVIKTSGQIEEIPKNHFDINSPVQGVVTSILVDLGDVVKVGQPLAVIKSTEIARLQAEVGQLKAETELAKSYYEREKSLFEQGISPKKDFEASKTVLASTEAKLNAAESNLKILAGFSVNAEQGEFTVKAQKTGTVTERNIAVGQVVNPNQILFRGVELSNVWASADIYEKDLNKVSLGQHVSVTLDAIPDKIFEGKLTYIGSLVNKETRTLPVKATLPNPIGPQGLVPLQPGTFIQLLIYTGETKKSILIPKTALVETDKEGTEGKHEHIVYVKKEDFFIPRKVLVDSHDSNSAIVLSGLIGGEIIVTQGAYQLQYAHGKENKNDKKKLKPHN